MGIIKIKKPGDMLMKKLSAGTVSAIVPIYKTPEKYLRQCIESVLAQTYDNFQLILVDDGSPDDSGAICEEYAARDTRVVVLHQKNQGVSAARNTGLYRADGQFLTFLDSDDFLESNAWEVAVSSLTSYNADVAVFGWVDFYNGGSYEHHITDKPYPMPASDFQWEIACHNYNCGGGYPWNKLWRLDRLYENSGTLPMFDVTLDMYEDKLWALQAATCLNRVVLLPETLYQYRFLSSSLTEDETRQIPRLYKAYHAYDLILDYLQPVNREAYVKAYNFYYEFCTSDVKYLRQLSQKDKKYEQQYRDTRIVFHKLCKRIRPRTLLRPILSLDFFYWLCNYWLPFPVTPA